MLVASEEEKDIVLDGQCYSSIVGLMCKSERRVKGDGNHSRVGKFGEVDGERDDQERNRLPRRLNTSNRNNNNNNLNNRRRW